MVILALPERVALEAVSIVGKEMKPGALLSHTLSVQTSIATKIKDLMLPLEVIGLNPMFAPSLSIVNRPIAVIIQNNGTRVVKLIHLLENWEGRVVILEPEEHDQLVAVMQALTHAAIYAFGLALADFNVDITKLTSLAPPPHATMLALLARIISSTPEVYWDIQSANQEAKTARTVLVNAINGLNRAMKDESTFIEMINKTRKVFGNELDLYKYLCTRIFNEPFLEFNRNLKEENNDKTTKHIFELGRGKNLQDI